ncbi:hypothetical protein HD597_009328 [Nonomuraea thailandensis]|uniref:DNA primase n=1 Tax=Nonomuraea thailandensis TaxID=1188745 RepID=A0A9X2GXU3_9ACTN|nr:hypothetical protein [Nonomuraea thailandensis]MCP2362308.1 hypothetical protein [Nonomuraea thailandensis]
MSNKLRIAFALLAGYFLGRRRKLRMAAALAAAGLAGRARGGKGGGGSGGGLLSQGIKTLTSSADVAPIVDRLRGDLLEVGKAAAVAAAGRQIDSLSDKLHERAEAMRAPGQKPGDDSDRAGAPQGEQDGAEEPEDTAEDTAAGTTEDTAEGEDEDYGEEPEAEAREPEARERTQRRPRMLRRTRRAMRGSDHG